MKKPARLLPCPPAANCAASRQEWKPVGRNRHGGQETKITARSSCRTTYPAYAMSDPEEEESDPLVASTEDVAAAPSDSADPMEIVRQKIPADIFDKFEIFSYRNAAVILSETRRAEFDEILTALRNFTITTDIIRRAGGNESEIPKLLTAALRPLGWHETVVQGDLLVRLLWREQTSTTKKGKAIFEKKYRELLREKISRWAQN
jgi:hypothetical protein